MLFLICLVGLLSMALYFIVLRPLIPLIILKIKLGDEALLQYFPILGDDFYMLFSNGKYGDAKTHHQNLVLKYPKIKVILSNFLFSPNIIFTDPEFFKVVTQNHHLFKRENIFFNDQVLHRTIGFIDGPEWKKKRYQQSCYFSFQAIQEKLPKLKNLCKEIFQEEMANLTDDEKQNGRIIEIYDLTTHFAGELILQTFFNEIFSKQQINGKKSTLEIAKIFGDCNKFMLITSIVLRNALLDPFFAVRWSLMGQKAWNFLPSKRQRSINERFQNIRGKAKIEIEQKITEKIQQYTVGEKWKQDNFLDLLVNYSLDPMNPSKFDMEQAQYVLQTFIGTIFGGTDTTSHLMASMLFALAYYPKVQAEIREEIEDIVKDFSNLSYQDIGLFKKIPALINEVFRYYSMTLNVVPRKAVDDFQVQSILIKKGWYVNCLTYFTLCNKRYYEQPEKFDISRWIKHPTTGSPDPNPFLFIPFSAGPRNCLGQHLALMETKVLIAYILKNYQVVLNEKVMSLDQKPRIIFNFFIEFERQDLVKLVPLKKN